jgi:cell division protein FtsQ
MDRSFAGRLGIGGLTRQPAPVKTRSKGDRRPARRQVTVLDWALARLAALLAAAARSVGTWRAFVWRRRRLRIALIVCVVAVPLLAGGWLWLRGSSLVAVRHVRVIGAHGSDASAIDATLSSAARGMTTLDVHSSALRSAVAAYPVVSGLKVSTTFPHGLSIRVIEQTAVAALTVSGAKTAIAANGIVLGPGSVSGSLPVLSGFALPAPGQRLHDDALLGAAAVLGAAPAPLAKQVTRAYSSDKGLTLVMHSGLLVYFGDSTLAHAKWLSLARVLADPGSAGASYVDVRLPERPAAGFPGGVVPALGGSEGEASSGSTTSGGESTQALAEGLSAAVGGGSTASAPASSPAASGESEATSSAAQSSEAQGESSSTSGEQASGAASSGPPE